MKKVEEWRDIEGYEGIYQVSSYGNVRSLDRSIDNANGILCHYKGKTIYQSIVGAGYKQVSLYLGSKYRKKYVHQLVAKAFLPNPRNLYEINHKDHNKENNCVTNLEWCTHLENIIDMEKNKNGIYLDSHNRIGINKCIDCGKPVKYPAKRCRSCASKHVATYNMGRPLNKEEVENSLIENVGNFTKSAKEFNMTDNALRKWCRKYDLPTHSRDWRK